MILLGFPLQLERLIRHALNSLFPLQLLDLGPGCASLRFSIPSVLPVVSMRTAKLIVHIDKMNDYKTH